MLLIQLVPRHRHAWTLVTADGRKTLRCDCGEVWDDEPYRQEYREWAERRTRRIGAAVKGDGAAFPDPHTRGECI